jgi:predicted nucleic acid-binding protein
MSGGATRVVVDSSAWIEYFRATGSDADRIVDAALLEGDVLLPDLIMLEVMRGFMNPENAKSAETLFAKLINVEIAGMVNARMALFNNAELRAKGITIRNSIDLLIGTWCIENDASLVHQDRDFDGMERHLGLKVWRGP